MNVEVVAVGTELLLGQIVDTNSSWIGEQLALAGLHSHFQTKVGDNPDRMRLVIGQAIERSDAVIITGGLGPTHDDITRDIIAELTDRPLVRDDNLVEIIKGMYAARNSEMPSSNLSQADVPQGGWPMAQQPGTAAGLVVPVGDGADAKVIYAMPGVPYEMHEMMLGTVVPDLIARSGETAVIASRTLRTWGVGESNLGEMLADEIARLDDPAVGVTLAFNASGVEGLKIRLTARAASDEAVAHLLDEQEARVRDVVGPIVFGVDDHTREADAPRNNMEAVVLDALRAQGLTLGTAETISGGMVASRLVDIGDVSDVYRGSLVALSPAVRVSTLGLDPALAEAPASGEQVAQMATNAANILGVDAVVAIAGDRTGGDLETVWLATLLDGGVEVASAKFPSDRNRLRQYSTITALNALRLRLVKRA